MDGYQFKEAIKNLSVWRRGDERAPHKPLLILLALGQLQVKKAQHLLYAEVRES